MPLVAIQLLWINVVTDGVQDFALSFEKAEEGILNEPPRDPKESIFNKELLQEILVSGAVVGAVVFIVWFILLNKLNMEVSMARGYIMALMVFIQNIHVFNCRSESNSAFSVPLKNNWLVVVGVIVSVLLHVIVMESTILSKFLQTVKIPFNHMILLFLISALVLAIIEVYKMVNNMYKEN
jgi:magnesium-transporting ATPase (P-type)